MLTVTSKTKDILRTIEDEDPRTLYWLVKKLGGDKKFDEVRDDLLRRAYRTRSDQESEAFEWNSKDGNKWYVWEQARYFPSGDDSFCHPISFCYYQTIGSIGVFLPSWTQGETGDLVVIHFTNHFFLRFSSWTKVKVGSKEMLKRFFSMIHGFTIHFNDEYNEAGLQTMDVRLPGSLGRGCVRKDGMVIDVRTFLPDKNLSKKQLKETEHIRKTGDKDTFEPKPLLMQRLEDSLKAVNSFMTDMDRLKEMGVDSETCDLCSVFNMIISRAFVELDYADAQDPDFWERHTMNSIKPLLEFAPEVIANKLDSHAVIRNLPNLLTKIAKADGIRRKFNMKECLFKVNGYWQSELEKYKNKHQQN